MDKRFRVVGSLQHIFQKKEKKYFSVASASRTRTEGQLREKVSSSKCGTRKIWSLNMASDL